jgi:hypothetical protein
LASNCKVSVFWRVQADSLSLSSLSLRLYSRQRSPLKDNRNQTKSGTHEPSLVFDLQREMSMKCRE